MTKFFLIIIITVFVIPYLLGVIGRFLFGSRPRPNSSSRTGDKTSSSRSNTASGKKKKVFKQDEGEYVDYVEIKDK